MSNVAAAPVAITLNETEEFLMSPLTDRDITELNNFIKKDILDLARSFCSTESNKMIIEATMKIAMEQVGKVDWILDSDLLQNLD